MTDERRIESPWKPYWKDLLAENKNLRAINAELKEAGIENYFVPSPLQARAVDGWQRATHQPLLHIVIGKDLMEYRYLKKGEIVQEGDETDSAPDGYNDAPRWVPVHPGNVGDVAPDPQYPSHRQFRRLIANAQPQGE